MVAFRKRLLVARPRLRPSARVRADVRAAGPLEQHGRHHRRHHVGTAGDDPVVDHEGGVAVADGPRERLAELGRQDQVAGLGEARDVGRDEEGGFMRDRP
jgi:hypothetical protein